jgi:hypothetical protein
VADGDVLVGRDGELAMLLAQQADALGAHLEVSVRTERHCGYLPEPAAALTWTVER